MTKKFLGIVMTPLDVQVEGLAAVMDRIEATGATAISCGHGLNREAPKGQGHRVPPLDIDGYERVFDRPVWGKRELYLEGFSTVKPDLSLYADTPYKPGYTEPPPELDRELPDKIYEAARERGWKTYASASPLSVPGLADADQMRWVDGSIPDSRRRVARQGCPSAPNVRAYAIASVLDTIGHDPQIDGICLDWVEYTTYLLEDHFSCFSPHSQRHAEELGYDVGRIASDAKALWDHLHNLTGASLEASCRIARNPSEMLDLLVRYPGWLDLLRFKSDVVYGLYAEIRQAMNDAGYANVELIANGWAPPFNRSSGMDYGRLSGTVQCVRPKLYTFHWSAMPRWYGQILKAWNPQLGESAILTAIKAWFNLPDDIAHPTFANYHIPGPDENHPVHPKTFRERIDEVTHQVNGQCPVMPLAHGYRPAAQWKRMVAIVRDSPADGMWVQRYCYLSDEKLRILREFWC
ncbi:MAG: hypothetical protein O7E52_14060 [Candidatus Poribacteria bacterium]|nr:hypothetical protein [Candidatus Poribacteria bacterium]